MSVSSSRAPTRRVVAWPVVAKLSHHSRLSPGWLTAVRAGVAIVVAASLGVLVLAAFKQTDGAPVAALTSAVVSTASSASAGARASGGPATKALAPRVSGDPVDTLATPEPAPAAVPVAHTKTASAAKAKPAHTAHTAAHASAPARPARRVAHRRH